jgi:hypothetical protein
MSNGFEVIGEATEFRSTAPGGNVVDLVTVRNRGNRRLVDESMDVTLRSFD